MNNLFTLETPVSQLVPFFLATAQIDQTLRGESVAKYEQAIARFVRLMGDMPIGEVTVEVSRQFKHKLITQGNAPTSINGLLYPLRKLLAHCQQNCGLSVLDPKTVLTVKVPRKPVTFLTEDELERFFGHIKVHLRNGAVNFGGLQFRTLAEVLAGTGMRISEALSLDISTIDWQQHQAKILGKGQKYRTVFFTDRAMRWLRRLIDHRKGNNPAVFVSPKHNRRLARHEAQRLCRITTAKSGITKRVTLHTLRHTFATTLLKNGCPIGHIQGLLGHDRLETTCRYYLGMMDESSLKKAHERFLEW